MTTRLNSGWRDYVSRIIPQQQLERKAMTQTEIRQHLLATGWASTGTGHASVTKNVRIEHGERLCRVRFNKLSLAIEAHSFNGRGWFWIGGGDYAQAQLMFDGRLRVLTYFFEAKG